MNPELPADLFTSCLTTPIKMALRWFVMQNQGKLAPRISVEMLDKIPGKRPRTFSQSYSYRFMKFMTCHLIAVLQTLYNFVSCITISDNKHINYLVIEIIFLLQANLVIEEQCWEN